jgi:hypothetical protein
VRWAYTLQVPRKIKVWSMPTKLEALYRRLGAHLPIPLSRNTNNIQLCNRIYYSKFYWRLNMFRAAHRSSSGWILDNSRSPHGHINQRLQIQFRTPDDERCAARNMLKLQKNFGIINSITKLHLVGISTG